MGARARILFRCDADAAIGGGHVMRCLALADALKARGAVPVFAVNGEAMATVPALARAGYPVRLAERPGDLGDQTGPAFDIIVFDHYRTGAAEHKRARADGARIVVIDDLGDRVHDCALLIDHNHGKSAQDYAGRAPDGAQVLTGARFALLRPEFAAHRAASLTRRAAGALNRVLVSFGLTDVGAITIAAYQAVRSALPQTPIDVIAGPRAPSRERLEAVAQRDHRLALHEDARDVAGLMAQADLALGAAGGGALERCALGLPSLIVTVADNQRALAAALNEAGAAMALGQAPLDARRVASALSDLKAAPTMVRVMSDRAAAICDGRGVERVAQAVLGLSGHDRSARASASTT